MQRIAISYKVFENEEFWPRCVACLADSRSGNTCSRQTCKKIIFVREPGFGFENVQTIYLDKLAQFRVIRVNIMVCHVEM